MNRHLEALDRWITTEPEDGPAYWVGVAIAGYDLDVTDLEPVPWEELVPTVRQLCLDLADGCHDEADGAANDFEWEVAWKNEQDSLRFTNAAANLDPARVNAPHYARHGDAAEEALYADQAAYVLDMVAGIPFSRSSLDPDSYTRVLVVEEVER